MVSSDNRGPAARLIALGYSLGLPPSPAALYKTAVRAGRILYVSGAVPVLNGKLLYKGKVPSAVGMEDAKRAARLCAALNLRMAHHALGTLDAVVRVIRLTGYVNSDCHFTDQHIIINGASELLQEVFGDAGVGARSAVGMAQLPLGATVETELILETHGEGV